MTLKYLTDAELDSKVKSLWKEERRVLHQLLLVLKEVEGRKSYLARGHASFFNYLVDELGADGGTAQRRIDAVRLMMDVPAVSEKIQSGELSLNRIHLIQKACRTVKQTRQMKVSAEVKSEIITAVAGLETPAAEKEIARMLDLPVLTTTSKKFQADESVRIELTVSKDLYEKIQQAQSLLSHNLGTSDLVAYLEYVTTKVIKSKTSIREFKASPEKQSLLEQSSLKQSSLKQSHLKQPPPEESTSARKYPAAEKLPHRETTNGLHFSARQKKIVLRNQECCQFVDRKTGRRCESRWFLQVDHVRPRWSSGSSLLGNSQLLCRAHNNLKYFGEARIKFRS